MSKTNYAEIARLAGVGTATVERVLNGRGGVRPDKVQKVIIAARTLEYPRKLPDAHRALLRIEVLMVRPETAFFRRLSLAFERIAATLDPLIVVQRRFVDELKPREIAQRILSDGEKRAGLILAVPGGPEVGKAIQTVASRGIPVIHVVTRASHSAGEFVGIDNLAAGRSAALFLMRMVRRPGPVVAFCHPIYQVHRDRIKGFSDFFAENPSELIFQYLAFSGDEEQNTAEQLLTALKKNPDLVGIYNAGGANSGLISVLRRHQLQGKVFFVGHELTDYTAAALRDGIMDVVLDQVPEAQAQRAIDFVLRRIGFTDIEPDPAPIRFTTITAANV